MMQVFRLRAAMQHERMNIIVEKKPTRFSCILLLHLFKEFAGKFKNRCNIRLMIDMACNMIITRLG